MVGTYDWFVCQCLIGAIHMLLATGMLSNRDESLYEAARIDGASIRFNLKLRCPILTATTPVLIGQLVTLTILVFSLPTGNLSRQVFLSK